MFDEVFGSLVSAAFVVAQDTINGCFVEEVIYEDDGETPVSQLEDKARAKGRPVQDKPIHPALMYHVGYVESLHCFPIHPGGEQMVTAPGQFLVYAFEGAGRPAAGPEIGGQNIAVFVADVADVVRA